MHRIYLFSVAMALSAATSARKPDRNRRSNDNVTLTSSAYHHTVIVFLVLRRALITDRRRQIQWETIITQYGVIYSVMRVSRNQSQVIRS